MWSLEQFIFSASRINYVHLLCNCNQMVLITIFIWWVMTPRFVARALAIWTQLGACHSSAEADLSIEQSSAGLLMPGPQSPESHSAEPLMRPHFYHHLISQLLGKNGQKKACEIPANILSSAISTMLCVFTTC